MKRSNMKKWYLIASFPAAAATGIGAGLTLAVLFDLSGSAVAGMAAGTTTLVMVNLNDYFNRRTMNDGLGRNEASTKAEDGPPPAP